MSRTSPIPDDDTHTIFLLQRTSHQNTRTFYDYPSIVTFAQAVVTMFEEHLRAKNPGRPTVNYGFPELTQFIDSFYDVSALTFNKSARMYEPHDKLWVKQQCIVYLQKLLR